MTENPLLREWRELRQKVPAEIEAAAMQEACDQLKGTPGDYPTIKEIHALRELLLSAHWEEGMTADEFRAAMAAG